jgi:hypothetical protein
MAETDTHVTDLEHLFAAPLAAVLHADFMAARQFAEHLEAYGFVPPEPRRDGAETDREHLGELRMVSFSFDQMEGPRPVRRVMRVPALSLIPLPLLQVRRAELTYGVRVLSARRRAEKKPLRLLKERADAGLSEPAPYAWRAMLAAGDPSATTSSPRAPHLESNVHVKVEIAQADIPAGLNKLFALMGENVQVRSVESDRVSEAP